MKNITYIRTAEVFHHLTTEDHIFSFDMSIGDTVSLLKHKTFHIP